MSVPVRTRSRQPDLVLVYGDVNSTVAAALVCAKLGTPVGHVEAGLRSFDRTMPEEINRLVTDQLSDLLFTPSIDGNENLAREGVAPEKVFLVGNVMIDTLVRLLPTADRAYEALSAKFPTGTFGLVTLHRPSNVDQPETFLPILSALSDISRDLPLVFPVHPRTRLRWAGELAECSGIQAVEPLSYVEFLAMQKHARIVITDSGGIQEETTYLGTPCLTMRENTERPITTTVGTNVLVGFDWQRLRDEVRRVLAGEFRRGGIPPLWDGEASRRIARIICGEEVEQVEAAESDSTAR
jgi:UDP-N-acetylglucosamine 2-epimerase (non-hydrolysing)